MNRILKGAVLSAAVLATTLTAFSSAEARDWGHWHHGGYHHGHGDAIGAGIVGLAAGALIGGALASQSDPGPDYDGYYATRGVRPHVYGRVAYEGGIEPWTRDWYEFCSDHYRSFNARSGTFTGYDGEQHFCVAN
jgi:hypothetical protein